MAVSAIACHAAEFVFENDCARIALKDDGNWGGLSDKAGTDWLVEKPGAFAFIRQNGRIYASTRIQKEGDDLLINYGQSGVTTRNRITAKQNYFVIELADIQGAGVDEVCIAQAPVRISENIGWWLDVRNNEKFAVCFVGLSMRVNTGGMRAAVYQQFGMKGEKVAIIAAPTPRLLDIVQEVEKDNSLPSPRIAGQWAKRSADIKRGYLFLDVTEANVDEVIRYAQLGHFQYVMVYDSTWSTSLGSYPINLKNYPRGEASLKATVDKLHAAGLKAGLHMLTSFVGKNDPLVRPAPDKRLLKDAQAMLATDVSDSATELPATAALDAFPNEAAFYGASKQGFDLLIDDEIIRYSRIGGTDGKMFLGCQRGAHGTRKAAHKAGAAIHHLAERYGCYLVDLRTNLKDELAERIAGIVNRCGFDMIYFDGGECNDANGPFWYWVSVQQTAIWQRFQRDVLVQGSGGTPWTWHFFARGACDDFAAVAPKQYLDFHKINDSWRSYTQSYMPAELGWWGFLEDMPSQPATSPDEVEYYAIRMLALDTPVSLETNLAALKRNGRTDELLELLGRYERLRLSETVPREIRDKLKIGEWHMVGTWDKPAFAPIRYETHRVDVPAKGAARVHLKSEGQQALRFRLQAAPALAPVGDKSNLVLLACESPAEMSLRDEKTPMPGALAASVDFTQAAAEQVKGIANARAPAAGKPGALNLLRHRAIAVRLRVDSAPPADQRCAVLNVQLEGGAKTYRDHYIDLDFTGERTIVIPQPNTQRLLPEFRPAPRNYEFKSAMYGFDYGRIERVNLRWMRLPPIAPVKCSISRIEALAEIDRPIEKPVVSVGGASVSIPVTLNTGDYAEYEGQSPIRVFDRNGVLVCARKTAAPEPQIPDGDATISVSAASGGSVKLTLVTLGDALPASAAADGPDLILHNGKIVTVDSKFSIQQAIAITGERITAVGTDEQILKSRGPNTKVINLGGKMVLPGLIDSHLHATSGAMTEFDHPIPDMQSVADVLAYIKARAEALGEGKWVCVHQVFITRLREQRYPTRAELDEVAPRNPVMFATGPDASLNTLALKLSGIGRDFKVTDGGPGFMEKDASGEPTGILRSCTRFVKSEDSDRRPTDADYQRRLIELFKDYNSVGLTSISDRDTSPGEIERFRKMRDSREITVRMSLLQHIDTIGPMEKILDNIRAVARSPLRKDDPMLRLVGIKTYLDGGMLTGSAYMRRPWGVSKIYAITDPEYRGVLFIPHDRLLPIVRTAVENGLQFNAHCVGDGAVHTLLGVYDEINRTIPVRPTRPCLAHSNFMSREAVDLLAKLGAVVDIQPAWLYLDTRTLVQQFGYERLRYFQPLKSIFEAGATAGGGSDHMQKIGSLRSINPYNPFLGMSVTLTRKARWYDGQLHPEEALTREQAIRFYTMNNAYIIFREQQVGSLEAGKFADLIVVDRDLLTCPVDQIKETEVLETYLGGKRVFARE